MSAGGRGGATPRARWVTPGSHCARGGTPGLPVQGPRSPAPGTEKAAGKPRVRAWALSGPHPYSSTPAGVRGFLEHPQPLGPLPASTGPLGAVDGSLARPPRTVRPIGVCATSASLSGAWYVQPGEAVTDAASFERPAPPAARPAACLAEAGPCAPSGAPGRVGSAAQWRAALPAPGPRTTWRTSVSNFVFLRRLLTGAFNAPRPGHTVSRLGTWPSAWFDARW